MVCAFAVPLCFQKKLTAYIVCLGDWNIPVSFFIVLMLTLTYYINCLKSNCAQLNFKGEFLIVDAEYFLKLENQLCFSIYACSREITRLYRPILDQLELTYPQFLALTVLWEHKRLTVKEMSELLYLDSGTLTPMLKRMETMDLLKRERSREDERKVFIELTEKGVQLRKDALQLPEKCIPHFGLSKTEYYELLQKINQMITSLQKVTRTNNEVK